jgi:hypothetical protein
MWLGLRAGRDETGKGMERQEEEKKGKVNREEAGNHNCIKWPKYMNSSIVPSLWFIFLCSKFKVITKRES